MTFKIPTDIEMSIPLQHLAAAALIHWKDIPEQVRTAIREEAEKGSMVLPATTNLKAQIAILIDSQEK